MISRSVSVPLLVLSLFLAAAVGAVAEEPAGDEEVGWTRSAELSLVSTSGNSEADTFGFKVALARTLADGRFSATASGIRAESTLTERTAIGPSVDDFVIEESSASSLTAENYTLGGRYERTVSPRVFWHLGVTWERNEFAGFSDRLTGIAGAGHRWWEREDSRLSTDYALTYTRQDDLVPDPRVADTFAGLRVSYDYARNLGSATELGSTLVVNQNLDEADDLRADLTNSVAVAMSRRLSLKVSLQVLYDQLPALGSVPLEFPAGTPTGETVPFELDEVDTILTTALVVAF